MRSIEPTGRSEEVMPIPDHWNCEQINLTQGSFQSHKLTCIHRHYLILLVYLHNYTVMSKGVEVE